MIVGSDPIHIECYRISEVSEEFLEIVAGLVFPRLVLVAAREFPACEFKPFAEVALVLLVDRFRAAFLALMRMRDAVVRAVLADAHVGVALVTGLAASGLDRELPDPAALVTMSSGGHAPNLDRNPQGDQPDSLGTTDEHGLVLFSEPRFARGAFLFICVYQRSSVDLLKRVACPGSAGMLSPCPSNVSSFFCFVPS